MLQMEYVKKVDRRQFQIKTVKRKSSMIFLEVSCY